MLNRVILMGRITHDLEVRQTPSGVSVLSFRVAVDRNFSDQNGQRQTDFIDCVAWRQHADFINRYFGKGRMIAIEGNLRVSTFDDKNTGAKRSKMEVYVDSVSFTGEPKKDGGSYQGGYQNGGYNNGGYNNSYNSAPQNNYQQPQQYQQPAAPAQQENMSIGGMDDFEEVISDDGVPF